MSRATDFLLTRNGRDQYGNAGTGGRAVNGLPCSDVVRALHAELNEQFVSRYGAAWLDRYGGKTRKYVREDLARGHWRRCSAGTFSKLAKDFDSYEAFLLYWLQADKRFAMTVLGISRTEIDMEMARYRECGHCRIECPGSRHVFTTEDSIVWAEHQWASSVRQGAGPLASGAAGG